MKTLTFSCLLFLVSCASETIVSTTTPDGKTTTTVTKKTPPSEGLVLGIFNTMFKGFLSALSSNE